MEAVFVELVWPVFLVGVLLVFKTEVSGVLKAIAAKIPDMKKGPFDTQWDVAKQNQQSAAASQIVAEIPVRKGPLAISHQESVLPTPGNLTVDKYKEIVTEALKELTHLPPLSNAWEQALRSDVLKQLCAIDPLRVPIDVLNTLTGALAKYGHEITYRTIFGTQISLLLQLSRAEGPLRRPLIESLFERHAQLVGTAFPPDFNGWMSYLKRLLLVTEQDGEYSIAPRGVAFLDYMQREKLSEQKPY